MSASVVQPELNPQSPPEPSGKGVVLAVDDEPSNLVLMEKLFCESELELITRNNGAAALEVVKQQPVDLVLLDVVMPDLDGYEVCKQIKQLPEGRDTSVVFVTGLTSEKDYVKGLECGADDFLRKPFSRQILLARVGSCLERRRLRLAERAYQQQLETIVAEKTQQLRSAQARLADLDQTKDEFLSLIAHELRTPLNGLLGAGSILAEKDVDEHTRQEFYEVFQASSRRMQTIIDHALLLTEIQVDQPHQAAEATDLIELLGLVYQNIMQLAAQKQVDLPLLPEQECQLAVPFELMQRGLSALFETALNLSAPKTALELETTVTNTTVHLNLEVSGCQIPEEYLDSFFDVFGVHQPIAGGDDLGLGPPVARRLLAIAGAAVAIRNHKKNTITFEIVAPLYGQTD